MQRFDLSSGVDILLEIGRIVAIITALKLGANLVALAIIQLTVALSRGLANMYLARRLYPECRAGSATWNRTHTRTVFAFGAVSSAIYVSQQVIFAADAIVIGAFLPVSMITLFVVGANLTDYTRAVVNGFAATITPRVSRLDAPSSRQELRQLVLEGAQLSMIVVLPIALTLFIRGGTFIGLWMGPAYAEPSGNVLAVLSIALAFWAGHQVVAVSLIGLNRHRPLAVAYLAEALTNLALSVALVQRTGIIGVAWATAVPSLIVTMVVSPALLRRVVGIAPSEIVTQVWLRPLMAMVPFALASWLLETRTSPNSILAFFLQVVMILPIAAAGIWAWAINPTMRQQIRNLAIKSWSSAMAFLRRTGS